MYGTIRASWIFKELFTAMNYIVVVFVVPISFFLLTLHKFYVWLPDKNQAAVKAFNRDTIYHLDIAGFVGFFLCLL